MSRYPLVRLGDVCQKITDGTHHSPQSFPFGDFKYVTAKNIKPGRLDLSDITFVDGQTHAEIYARCDVKLNDVLVVKDGATTGRVALNTLVEPFSLLSSVGVLRAGPELLPQYLAYALQEPHSSRRLLERVSGVAMTRVTLQKLNDHEIRVAPKREQALIVDLLDELLPTLDSASDELRMVKRKLAFYRQSLLKSAVEGNLTADWRLLHSDTESGAALLKRIGAVALSGACEADLPEIPGSWCWAPLSALGDITSGVAKGSKVRSEDSLREVPYLRVANVQRGYLDLSEVKSIPATERDIRDLSLQPGDVLFNEGGDRDKLGRGWVWSGEIAECIHQNHVFRLRPRHPDLQSEFISHHGNSFGRRWFEAAGKQTTNLASINLGILKRFPVPVPPAEEQRVIVERLRVELEAVAESERAVERGLRMASAQRQNILRAAFSGQLVPQDPNDEPASVLLERIHSQRQAEAPAAKRKPGRPVKAAA